MYKCCWNCAESAPAHANSERKTIILSCSHLFCCATYPVSNYLQDPFQKRYCKQFVQKERYLVGHEIDKKEADKLYELTDTQRCEYFGVDIPKEGE